MCQTCLLTLSLDVTSCSLFPPPDVDLTVTEAGGPDSRGEQADLYSHVDEGILGPPLTPDKDDMLQQATAVANLRAALMSKNSLLSLKADVLGDDSSLLLEYLPKGAHSLSRKCQPGCCTWGLSLGDPAPVVGEGVARGSWPLAVGHGALTPCQVTWGPRAVELGAQGQRAAQGHSGQQDGRWVHPQQRVYRNLEPG